MLSPPPKYNVVDTSSTSTCGIFSIIEVGRKGDGNNGPGTILPISMKIEIIYLQIWQVLPTYLSDSST